MNWVSVLLAFFISTSTVTGELPLEKKQFEGVIEFDVVAIGGETTGVVLRRKVGDLELDFGKNKKLRDASKALDGKTVAVTGLLDLRAGVEVASRSIVKVSSISAKVVKP